MIDLTRYRTEYGTPDDGNTLGEKEYNEGEDAYHQISQLIQDGYLVPDTRLQDIAHAWKAHGNGHPDGDKLTDLLDGLGDTDE